MKQKRMDKPQDRIVVPEQYLPRQYYQLLKKIEFYCRRHHQGKSGKDYYVHSAISNVTNNPEYEIKESLVLANCNIYREGRIKYLPAYMAMFLVNEVKVPVLEQI